MIILVALAAFAAGAGVGYVFWHRRGYGRGYSNGRIDGERRGWFRATGDWPEEPERRPGVMER